MAYKPLRNSQLIAFDNAAAGHPGVLSDKSRELIIKPCKQAEVNFYEVTTKDHPEFEYYIPTFFGTLTLNQNNCGSSSPLSPTVHELSTSTHGNAPDVPAPPETWQPSTGVEIKTDLAIVLENVAAGFKKPNILDVKLGARLWGDDAPPSKRQRLDLVSEETTSKPLGFRIAGMKTWMGEDAGLQDVDAEGYRVFDKTFGRAMSEQTIQKAFEDFFLVESAGMTRKMARKVINRLLGDLRGLQKTVEGQESRMYSASLLFVYEGDGKALEADFAREKELLELPAHVDGLAEEQTVDIADAELEESDLEDEAPRLPKIEAVKVIDFAHAAWTPGQGRDENMLHGIRNVVRILEEITK